jgi:hypothetical protein
MQTEMKRRLLALPIAVVAAMGTAAHTHAGQGVAAAARATCADESPPSTAPQLGAGSATRSYGAIALDGVGLWTVRPPTGEPLVYQGRHYRLLKAYVYVLHKPPTRVTVTVVSPRSVRLYYPSGSVGDAGPTSAQVVRGSAKSVRFSACPGPTGYTGGFLIQKPVCATLRISEQGHKARFVQVAMAPSRCHG